MPYFPKKLGMNAIMVQGHAVAYLVAAVSYKPERRCFDSELSHWIF
jgi:hypothetical protein